MPAAEDREQEGFKVEDRRRFSSDSGVRREAAPGPAQSVPESEARPSSEADSGSLPEMSFTGFVLGLGAQAMMLLGEVPDPGSGKRVRDPASARQIIDLIGILKEKTAGNLEQDEVHLLDNLLFDLRTKYVEISKQK